MSDKTGIEWADSTWTPLRARVKSDAGRIAAEKGFAEIDPFCCALLKHHYPNVPNYGDFTKIPPRLAVRNWNLAAVITECFRSDFGCMGGS